MSSVTAQPPPDQKDVDTSALVIDRVGPTRHPDDAVIGYQRWESMLFLHWPLEARALEPLVPPELTVDTCDGHAWVGVTLFSVTGARLRGLPEVPGLSAFHEVSVRTYVHREGCDPGVWFLSLDASSPATCALARLAVGLPYFPARISRGHVAEVQSYRALRWGRDDERPRFSASWRAVAGADFLARPGTLEYFLTERYFLYSRAWGRRLLRQQVHHRPWLLRPAERVEVNDTLTGADGLPPFSGPPLAHDSPGVEAELFLPKRVRG
jgi:uncharacterized protein YqjF (DUF2071 family)